MKRWVGPVAIALAAVGVLISAEQQDPRSYGYFLFSPVAGVPSGSGEVALRIDSCRMTPKGLDVRGYAAPDDPPIGIGVAQADPTQASLRVGVAFAAHAQHWPGAVPGDFRVIIPWATSDSRFAIVARGQAGSAVEAGERGPSVACPPDDS